MAVNTRSTDFVVYVSTSSVSQVTSRCRVGGGGGGGL